MKTSIKLIVAIVLTFSVSSCKKNEDISERSTSKILTNNAKIHIKQVESNEIKSLINSSVQKINNGLKSVDFDYTDLSNVSIDEVSNTAIIAYQIGYNPYSTTSYVQAFYLDNNNESVVGVLTVETIRKSDNIVEINYYSPDGIQYMSVNLNLQESTAVSTDYVYYGTSRPGWGERTVNCINDAYSNHGWLSAWAFGQTLYIPETGVAIGLYCAAKNRR